MDSILSENNLPHFKESVTRGKCNTLTEKTSFRTSNSVFNGSQRKSPESRYGLCLVPRGSP